MNILWGVGVAFVALFGFLILRGSSSEFAFLLPLGGVLLLLASLMPDITEILRAVSLLGEGAGLEQSSLSVMLRGMGIGLITRFASEICVDCGQRALGNAVDYFGQIAIVSLALPFVISLAQTVLQLV